MRYINGMKTIKFNKSKWIERGGGARRRRWENERDKAREKVSNKSFLSIPLPLSPLSRSLAPSLSQQLQRVVVGVSRPIQYMPDCSIANAFMINYTPFILLFKLIADNIGRSITKCIQHRFILIDRIIIFCLVLEGHS